MLRRAVWISLALIGLGAVVFYVGMSRAAPFDHSQGNIGIIPFLGGGLFIIGLIGAFAALTTGILTGMAPHDTKDKT